MSLRIVSRTERNRSHKTVHPQDHLQIKIVPDCVVPVQFDVPRTFTPEQRLALAVLEDALACLRGTATLGYGNIRRAGRKTLLQTEAQDWFASHDASSLFSFINVCAALGIDHDWLRRRLRRRSHHDPPSRTSFVPSRRWSANDGR